MSRLFIELYLDEDVPVLVENPVAKAHLKKSRLWSLLRSLIILIS